MTCSAGESVFQSSILTLGNTSQVTGLLRYGSAPIKTSGWTMWASSRFSQRIDAKDTFLSS